MNHLSGENKLVWDALIEELPEFQFDLHNENSTVSVCKGLHVNRIMIIPEPGGMLILNSDGTWQADGAPWAG